MKAATALLVAVAVAGCGDRGDRAERFFGTDVWSVMERADRADAYRLEPTSDKPAMKGGVRISGAPQDPGEDWLKVFALVEDPRSYDWNARNRIKPRPEVLFRFVRGNKSVDLLIAFSANKASLDWTGSTDESKWVDVRNARPHYVELVQRVFLLDPFIRSLQTGLQMPGPMPRRAN